MGRVSRTLLAASVPPEREAADQAEWDADPLDDEPYADDERSDSSGTVIESEEHQKHAHGQRNDDEVDEFATRVCERAVHGS
jgi:hypothetical protein